MLHPLNSTLTRLLFLRSNVFDDFRVFLSCSINDFIGGHTQCPGYRQTECLRDSLVDDQLNFCRRLRRKVAWLLGFEDAAGVLTNLTICPRYARAITEQHNIAPRIANYLSSVFDGPLLPDRQRDRPDPVDRLPD